MDLNLLTIARRANLGEKIETAFNNALLRISQIESLTEKLNTSVEFSAIEKTHNREFSIIGLVSITEHLLNEVLYQVLVSHPKKLGAKKFDIDELMKEGSMLELISSKAAQKLLDLAYGKFENFIGHFTDSLELTSVISNEFINTVNEIKCTRDCLLHSQGLSSELYLSKAGTKARVHSTNQQLPTDDKYFQHCVLEIRRFIEAIRKAIPPKFTASNKSYVFKQMWESTCLNNRIVFDAAWKIKNSDLVEPVDLDRTFGFSSSEMAVYNLFRFIYSGREDHKVDFALFFRRWSPKSRENQMATSWLDNQFYF